MNDVQRGNDAVAIGRIEQECDRVVYEYALVKVVPCLERGECINAGVIVYSQERNFLVARTDLDEDRLLTVAPRVDVVGVRSALEAVEAMCRGGTEAGMAAGERPGARFRWLTAPRSTIVQAGPVHVGLAQEPGVEVERLLDRLVR